MNNGIRILTEDEINKIYCAKSKILRAKEITDTACAFGGLKQCGFKNYKALMPYLIETGGVPKFLDNHGNLKKFDNFDVVKKEGLALPVPNYDFDATKKYGISPVIPLSCFPEDISKKSKEGEGIFYYGYYPNSILDEDEQREVSLYFCHEKFNNYGTIKIHDNDYHVIEIFDKSNKYKKYIDLFEIPNKVSTNGFYYSKIGTKKYMWAKLEPIKWIIYKEYGIAVAMESLMAGIKFNDTFDYDSFEDTNLYKWLNTEFINTLMKFEDKKLIIHEKQKEEINIEEIIKEDYSNFSFDNLVNKENNRKKELGIDLDSINEFKKKIKNVTEEEAEKLGKELFNRVFKNSYKDENYDDVLRLIMDGANVNFRNDNDKANFPLIMCARKNYLKTFIALIKAGADINMTNSYGTTSVMAAARHGNKEILEMLILMGADINAKCADGGTALSSAILHNQKECFDMLVDAGANLNSTNLKGQTIFDYEKGMDVASSINSSNVSVSKQEQEMSFDDLLSEAINTLQNITDNKSIQKVKK